MPLTSTFGIRWKVSYGQQQQQQQKKQMPVMPGGCIAQAAGSGTTIAAAVVAVIGRPYVLIIFRCSMTNQISIFTTVCPRLVRQQPQLPPLHLQISHRRTRVPRSAVMATDLTIELKSIRQLIIYL